MQTGQASNLNLGKSGHGKAGSTPPLFSFSTFSLFPSSLFQLTPTAHLLYLAAHLMLQHGATQARLIWYYDLHLLATREAGRLDWDELLVRAREFRWAAALHAALLGTQERFGTPLPAGFLDALAAVQDRQAVRSVERKACPFDKLRTAPEPAEGPARSRPAPL